MCQEEQSKRGEDPQKRSQAITTLPVGVTKTGTVRNPAGDQTPGGDLTQEAHRGTQDSRKCRSIEIRNRSLDPGIMTGTSR